MAGRNTFNLALSIGFFFSVLAFSAGTAQAHSHRHHHRSHAIFVRPEPASITINADTGRVMESENADAQRYPASLTKMMTLYLTFDAIKKGNLNFDDMISVSENAASQPQTNIALAPGDGIAVKDAVLSIVVRSANDSAVALGEALGGSEEGFAHKMNSKARSLGMRHTVFYNPSGLPDPRQHTTARDMATLGLALRRDFPEYFPLFKTESFTFRGITYVTHNHVMTRYEGVDGIKTGYIRASGYNLVTSATRDNHHIVAVVLGGSTFRARDDKMIAMLDHSFAEMASLPGNRVHLAYSGRRISAFPAKDNDNGEVEGEGDQPGEATPAKDEGQHQRSASEHHEKTQQLADLSDKGAWGIQVGAFARNSDAKSAAHHAIEKAKGELSSSVISISDENKTHAVHRARLTGLTQDQAEEACKKLSKLHNPCFTYRLD